MSSMLTNGMRTTYDVRILECLTWEVCVTFSLPWKICVLGYKLQNYESWSRSSSLFSFEIQYSLKFHKKPPRGAQNLIEQKPQLSQCTKKYPWPNYKFLDISLIGSESKASEFAWEIEALLGSGRGTAISPSTSGYEFNFLDEFQ